VSKMDRNVTFGEMLTLGVLVSTLLGGGYVLRSDIARVEVELSAQIFQVEAELSEKISQVQVELSEKIFQLKERVAVVETMVRHPARGVGPTTHGSKSRGAQGPVDDDLTYGESCSAGGDCRFGPPRSVTDSD